MLQYSTTTTIGPATAAEAEAIAAIVNAAYRGDGPTRSWTSEVGLLSGTRVDAAAVVAMTAETPPSLLVLRDADGTVLGCVRVEAIGSGIWYLSTLSVDPSLQMGGYGRRLVEAAEQVARVGGGGRMRMTVIASRGSLIDWYERRGYVRTGEVEAFPYDDPSVGTPLTDDLSFIVLEKPLATGRRLSW